MERTIIFVGNPGSGKSTLLNTCIGSTTFHSGVSIGTGTTTALQRKKVGNTTYCDTPGLDDIDKRATAAAEIGKAINEEEVVTLLFVITLESGRLRPADIATIKIVLNSITCTGVNMNKRYSIILNKLSRNTIKKLNQGYPKDELFGIFKDDFGLPNDLFYVELEANAYDEDDVLLSCGPELREFMCMCPSVRVSRAIRIDTMSWGQISRAIYHKVQLLFERALNFCCIT